MAALSLTSGMALSAAHSPQLQQLLSQLEPNTPPAVPSAWPLAIGYWLVLLAVLVLACLISYRWYRSRHWRKINRELNRIKKLAEPCAELHRLLRWVLITYANAPRSMNDKQLAERIAATLHRPLPDWVNAHYRSNGQPDIHWADVKQLLQRWKKEAGL